MTKVLSIGTLHPLTNLFNDRRVAPSTLGERQHCLSDKKGESSESSFCLSFWVCRVQGCRSSFFFEFGVLEFSGFWGLGILEFRDVSSRSRL